MLTGAGSRRLVADASCFGFALALHRFANGRAVTERAATGTFLLLRAELQIHGLRVLEERNIDLLAASIDKGCPVRTWELSL